MAYTQKRSGKKKQLGSYTMSRGYNRLIKEFSLPQARPQGMNVGYQGYQGNNYGPQQYNQYGYQTQQTNMQPGYPTDRMQPGQMQTGGYSQYGGAFGGIPNQMQPNTGQWDSTVSDAKPFVAVDVFNKVLQLSLIALFFGALSYIFPINPGIMFVLIFAGFILGMVGIYRPRTAKVMAPIYSAVEGLILGTISFYYSANGNFVVPLAIVGTAGIFVSVLALYRTGMVKVTPKFVSITIISTFSLLMVMIASMFLPISSLQGNFATFIIFGVIYLGIAILNLFVDFNTIYMAEDRGISAEGEWYAALLVMVSLIMTFLA
jgi:uncharacterized YccA/Bax inhibitor family protein